MNRIKRFVVMSAILGITLCAYSQDLIPTQNDKKKWGYVDADGRQVIAFKYDEALAFVDGYARVKKGNKYGYIDTEGRETIKIQYTEIGTWDDKRRAKVAVGGSVKDGVLTGAKYGFIDSKGNVLLKPEYTGIEPFKNGMAAINKDGKYGYINEYLDFIIPCKYSAIGSFNEQGLCWIANGGKIQGGKIQGAKFGVVNLAGTEVIKPDYQQLGTFNERIFISHPIITAMLNSPEGTKMLKELAKKNNKGMTGKGLLAGLTGDTKDLLDEVKDRAKKTTEEYVSQIVASVPEDVGRLLEETRDYAMLGYNFIDGRLYSSLDMTLDNHFAVSKNKFFIEGPFTFDLRVNDKIGIIDHQGNVIVKPGQYGLSFLPSDDVVPVVKRAGKTFQFNFMRRDGRLLLKKWIKGTGVIPFQNGTAAIASETGSYIIDRNGQQLTDNFDLILPQTDGNYIVKNRSGYGLISGTDGHTVIAPSYNTILPANSGLYCARKDASGLYGYIDPTGKYAIEPAYSDARSFSNGAATVRNSQGWGIIAPDNSPVVNFGWEDALPFSDAAPALCWVKRDNMWQCIRVADGKQAFEGRYFGARNFNSEGHATVYNAEGRYGSIDTEGNIVLPMQFSSPDLVSTVTANMTADGITTMSEIEAHRMNLRLNPERNNFRLSHTIDNSMWEY